MSLVDPDTIAAIVTPPGQGGVAIVRVSGPRALAIADQVFHCPAPLPSQRAAHTFVYGTVRDAGGKVDSGILLIWRSPASYTGEDVVEIQGHGGPLSSRRVLRAVLDAGARTADAGEFTRRAFLNGRMDLLQAEAVMDLVRAHSQRAQTAALEQLGGGLSKPVDALYDGLLQVAAQLEATLDFPEDELPETILPSIERQLTEVKEAADRLLAGWEEGHLLRDGAVVVLSGKPNVGKSTLLNALLDRPRAIVSATPGTTRDTLEESLVLEGIPLRLVDTAGLRDTACEIERQGIARTRKYMEEADLHLYMVDGGQPADPELLRELQTLPPSRTILVINKTDLPRLFHVEQPGCTVVETSLLPPTSVAAVRGAMLEKLTANLDLTARPHAVISERHRQLLLDALQELRAAIDCLRREQDAGLVPAVSALREALTFLGELSGREYHEELLDRIFSSFCIGK